MQPAVDRGQRRPERVGQPSDDRRQRSRRARPAGCPAGRRGPARRGTGAPASRRRGRHRPRPSCPSAGGPAGSQRSSWVVRGRAHAAPRRSGRGTRRVARRRPDRCARVLASGRPVVGSARGRAPRPTDRPGPRLGDTHVPRKVAWRCAVLSLCGCDDDKVVDSRPCRVGDAIRRRRECRACGHRFTTFERIELPELLVRKRSGHRVAVLARQGPRGDEPRGQEPGPGSRARTGERRRRGGAPRPRLARGHLRAGRPPGARAAPRARPGRLRPVRAASTRTSRVPRTSRRSSRSSARTHPRSPPDDPVPPDRPPDGDLVDGYTLCGSFRATPGDGDHLQALLLEAADLLGAAEGCLLYLVHRSDDDADAVWVVEVWTGRDAHQASLDVPGVQEVIGRARPLIAGMGERFELRPVGGLGLGGPALLRPETPPAQRTGWLAVGCPTSAAWLMTHQRVVSRPTDVSHPTTVSGPAAGPPSRVRWWRPVEAVEVDDGGRAARCTSDPGRRRGDRHVPQRVARTDRDGAGDRVGELRPRGHPSRRPRSAGTRAGPAPPPQPSRRRHADAREVGRSAATSAGVGGEVSAGTNRPGRRPPVGRGPSATGGTSTGVHRGRSVGAGAIAGWALIGWLLGCRCWCPVGPARCGLESGSAGSRPAARSVRRGCDTSERLFAEHLFPSPLPNARSDVNPRTSERVFACGGRPW